MKKMVSSVYVVPFFLKYPQKCVLAEVPPLAETSMLELIPALFAQQQLKQAVNPVSPIEPAEVQLKSASPVTTPTPAIATPESVVVEATFVPAPPVTKSVVIEATPISAPISAPITKQPETRPTSTPINSAIVLPKVPTAPTQTAESLSKPVPKQQVRIAPTTSDLKTSASTAPASIKPTSTTSIKPTSTTSIKPTSTTSIKPTEKPASSAPSVAPRSASTPELNSAQPDRTPDPSAIEIPVPNPNAPATSPRPGSLQKQLLEQRLADIVAKDRILKQAQQRDTLVARAYSYATQRRFEQARKLLQDPAISTDVRNQILSNINSLESASRTIGIAPIKAPVAKPQKAQTVKAKKPSTIATKTAPRTARSQQAITIQVPRAIQSLPIRTQARVNDPTVPIASDSAGGYIDQLVTPKNLQAYNRNLPKLTSKDQIVYPLPEPVPVTSKFGWRQHPVSGVRRFHSGVDLGAGQGTPVIASRGGKVTIADRMGGYGLAIVMEQPNGSQDTLYAHLSEIFVRPGEKIKPGAIIGRVGSTGLSTGPHLHYEARRMTNSGWTAVDPGGQLESARVRLVQARQINAQSSSDAGS